MSITNRRAATVALVAFAGVAVPLGAQASVTPASFEGAWLVTFPSDAYRYVDGRRVPVGAESWRLEVTPSTGDSLVARWVPEHGRVAYTLRGVVRQGEARLVFDRQGGLVALPEGGAASFPVASQPQVVGSLDLALEGDALRGVLKRGIVLPTRDGRSPLQRAPVTGRRAP